MIGKVLAILLITIAHACAQNQADVLNFALNLECLEGHFYRFAVYGQPLSAALTGNGPTPIGGAKAVLDTQYLMDTARSISDQETAHVFTLRALLGDDAIPCPQIDLGPSFAKLGEILVNKTLPVPFTPFNNSLGFLIGAFLLEDLGVSAYRGAAELLQGSSYVTDALESYHAGVVRKLLFDAKDQIEPQTGLTIRQLTDAIAELYTKISSVPQTGIAASLNGILHPVSAPADGKGLVYSRTPQQVLDVVYFGSSSKPGGLFPNGVNGYFAP